MRIFMLLLAGTLMASSFSASACGFRLKDGKLLTCNMSRIELLDRAGEPLSKDVEVHAISTKPQETGRRIETWSYILPGAIGGNYLVSITLEQGKVTAIESRQQQR
ncbi:hypothetical protein [Alkalimonas amylolytica]|uniref:DUF2845 domain-containing protein n=1 Tax=Alkalimonas amylolytica TaxID=152573 RepID=A0A1H4DIA3_ALKAM|nr:hypothetical protein [Alkalimonas amylolytica]SEA72189.1 hypothetical protein SAMN04488051_105257 [Alkalimonas amylolytica]